MILIGALESLLGYFPTVTGSTVSDDGLRDFPWVDATDDDIEVHL